MGFVFVLHTTANLPWLGVSKPFTTASSFIICLLKINLYYRTTHNGIPPDFLDKKQYHCSQCPEIFFNVQKFKSHESKHHGLWKPGQKLKQYQCKTCLEMFSGKRNYIAHCEKAHNEIIPLHHVDAIKCHSCEMIFSGT